MDFDRKEVLSVQFGCSEVGSESTILTEDPIDRIERPRLWKVSVVSSAESILEFFRDRDGVAIRAKSILESSPKMTCGSISTNSSLRF